MGRRRSLLEPISRRQVLAGGLGVATLSIPAIVGSSARAAIPVPVGILHSLTGTMATSEAPVVDATLLAIEEINAKGGVLGGRPLQPVVVDGASDQAAFTAGADALLSVDRAEVMFGCWTSASRKAVRPVVEAHDGLLFYPVQYEGIEQSPNIVYTGAAPNQQIIPAISWAMRKLGRRVLMVGSDYIFPRIAGEIVAEQVANHRGEVVGAVFLPLGAEDMRPVMQRMSDLKPDLIVNLINGDSNLHFFRALRAAGVTPETCPVISFSIGEAELARMADLRRAGDYAAWNYFQGIDRPEASAFLQRFRDRYGRDRLTTDPMEAGYTGVHLWARAVDLAGTTRTSTVRLALRGLRMEAPHALVTVDPATFHLWKQPRIGRVRPDGLFDVVWEVGEAIRPAPYPNFRPRGDWEALVARWHAEWGGAWVAPIGTE